MKPIKMILTALIVTTAFSFATSSALAQKKKESGIIRLNIINIEGRVQKPNAFFINTRQGIVYEVMEMRESFVQEIPKVVESGEF